MRQTIVSVLRFSERVDEGEEPSRSAVQLLRSGRFHHELYGPLEIGPELYGELIRNFEQDVRGIEIALDVEHRPEGGAAGWFRRLFTDAEGRELWGEVEWTSLGRRLVEEGLYKYLSVEYDPNYVDEEGQTHGPTLLGAALTNRPFLKRMQPAAIRLDEETEQSTTQEPIREETVRLRETIRRLTEELQALREEREALQRRLRETELRQLLESAKREGRVTPSMEPWLLRLGRECASLEAFRGILETLPVRVVFEELGSSQPPEAEGSDPAERLHWAVLRRLEELRAERPGERIGYGDALAVVSQERPDLIRAYREYRRQIATGE
ncbi:MAG: hypothetical protein KatS3mg115_1374 [Candidatus Poribacteria bacterium]|nr:MAG: hypothetical protein KatS3mg115_1374 [Candidatus Poribacteria bacterium]